MSLSKNVESEIWIQTCPQKDSYARGERGITQKEEFLPRHSVCSAGKLGVTLIPLINERMGVGG